MPTGDPLGPTGLALSAEGVLHFVTGGASVGVVEVTGSCTVPAIDASTCSNGVEDGDETDTDCGGAVCERCPLELLDGIPLISLVSALFKGRQFIEAKGVFIRGIRVEGL